MWYRGWKWRLDYTATKSNLCCCLCTDLSRHTSCVLPRGCSGWLLECRCPRAAPRREVLGVSSQRQWHTLFVPRCVLMVSKVASYSLGLTTTVRWSWKGADKSLREQGRGAHSVLVCRSAHGAVMESLHLLNSFRSLPWEACWGLVNEAALIFNNWNSVCDSLW